VRNAILKKLLNKQIFTIYSYFLTVSHSFMQLVSSESVKYCQSGNHLHWSWNYLYTTKTL